MILDKEYFINLMIKVQINDNLSKIINRKTTKKESIIFSRQQNDHNMYKNEVSLQLKMAKTIDNRLSH